VYALLIAESKGEFYLSCLRSIMARVLALQSRAEELAAEIRLNKADKDHVRELRHERLIISNRTLAS
jgi:hypothetical protein